MHSSDLQGSLQSTRRSNVRWSRYDVELFSDGPNIDAAELACDVVRQARNAMAGVSGDALILEPRRKNGDKSKNAKVAFVGVLYTLRETRDGWEGPINKRLIATFESHEALFRWLSEHARGYGRNDPSFSRTAPTTFAELHIDRGYVNASTVGQVLSRPGR